MNIVLLLPAIVLAALLFGACLWSLFQAIGQQGWLQYAHAAALALTLLGVASISWRIAPAGQITGICLGTAAATAIWHESGWSRLLPVPQLLLALILILNLAFIPNG